MKLNKIMTFILSVCFIGIISCSMDSSEEVLLKSPDTSSKKEEKTIKNVQKPVLITNPVSVKAVIPSECVFTAGAFTYDDGTLTYQWYETNENSESKIIDNATSYSYKVSVSEVCKKGYFCVITNTIPDNGDGGIKSAYVTSETAWLEAVSLCDVMDMPVFTRQPVLTCVPKGETAKFTCEAVVANYNVVYRLFETDVTGTTKTPLGTGWSSSGCFETTPFTEKGIRYFVCAASPYVPGGDDVPKNAAYSDIVAAAYTGLPVLYLDTEIPTSEITRESYVLGSFKMVSEQYGTQEYTFNKIKDGKAKEGIKGRGNSSWGMPKKGYNIKFDSKQSILGMPADKKWCIVANYSDKTLLRNKYASVLGNELFNSEWNPTFVSVDVVLNGEYVGNYLFDEKNTISEKRINVQDISDCTAKKINNNSFVDKNNDDVTDLYDGGFVLEIDARHDAEFCFDTTRGVPFTLKDPDEVSETIQTHIRNIVQNAEDVLYDDNFTDSDYGWRKYIDEDSIIDWYLVNEFAKNRDAIFALSVYMFYNPVDGKLHLGPNWDFDIGFGNDGETSCGISSDWYIKYARWIYRLFEDPSFVEKVKVRWNEKKSELQQTFSNTGVIQTLADSNSVSAQLNFMKWSILGQYVWPNAAGYESRTTYQSEVDYLKNWCSERYIWLDTAINGL